MNQSKNPAMPPILDMEPLVRDVPRIARILRHMECSDFDPEPDEVFLLSDQLAETGERLVALYEAAHKAAGGVVA